MRNEIVGYYTFFLTIPPIPDPQSLIPFIINYYEEQLWCTVQMKNGTRQ